MISTGDSESEAQNNDLADIYHGILRDDISLLQQGVLNRININTTFKGDSNLQHIGMTPLALAAALNKINALKFLLNNGANVNDTFASLRTTALMTASFHGHARVVDVLLRSGANVQAIDLQGSTALGYAFGGSRSVEVIGLLLKSGININQKNMLGMNALLLVAGYGDDKLVRMVLDAGADPNSVNDFGHSALHLVIVGKRSQLKKLAQDGAGDKMTLDNFNNLKNAEVALKDWAARNKKVSVDSRKLEKAASLMSNISSKLVKNLAEINDNSEQEVIKQRVEAVWFHRQEKLLSTKKSLKKSGKLESLLSCRGNKKNKNQDDLQPYLSAPSRSSKHMNTERDKEVIDLKEKFGRILMMIADAGCDVGATEKTFGMTALDMAILLEDVDSTGLLVARGADPEHLLKMFALSDMHEAIVSGDKKMVEKLLTYDVDLDINHPFSTFNVETKTDEDEIAGDFILSDGVTPLTVAVQVPEEEGHACKIVKFLLKNKAEVDKMGPGGTNPLTEACRVGNLKMAEMLISSGADVNIPCPRYNEATPIIVAAVFSREEIASLLADKLAKLDIETTDGKCALIEAYRNDNTKIVETILRGSLGQSFSNKGSFTYEMVVKYQRPDKTDVNVILKLLAVEVKRRDEDRREKELAARKKQSISFLRRVSEPSSDLRGKLRDSQETSELNSGQSDTAVISSAFSDSNLLEDSPKRKKNDLPLIDPSTQQASNHFEIPKFPSLEAHKVALISKVEENVEQGLKQIKSNLVSDVQSTIDKKVSKSIQGVFEELPIQQRNWSEHISDTLKDEHDVIEEDWEDDTDFQEHYYPAAGLENGPACLMTTPILGRCKQVRQNFAQADSYLKDVVKTGNVQKISRSVMRTIDDEFEEDEDDTSTGKKRTETDI